MEEITDNRPAFDYTALDNDVADFLLKKEMGMREIVGKTYTELGRELKEAQDKLALHGYGYFESWYTSLGFKRDQVYRWMNRYELIVANRDKQELLEDLPVSLTYEVAKPSADPAAVQAVLNGDIKTHKEYKALEKELKAAHAAAEAAEQRAEKAEAERTLKITQMFQRAKEYEDEIKRLEFIKNLSKEDAEKLQRLNTENVVLERKIREMQDDFKQKLTVQDDSRYALRETRKAFKNMMVSFNFENSQAEYYYGVIRGQKEAKESIEQFVQMFEVEILPVFDHWKKVLNDPNYKKDVFQKRFMPSEGTTVIDAEYSADN